MSEIRDYSGSVMASMVHPEVMDGRDGLQVWWLTVKTIKPQYFVFLHFAFNAILCASYVVSVKCPQEQRFPYFMSFLACYNENLHSF
jgi:hypothetical protein